jgi:hypothetical protein
MKRLLSESLRPAAPTGSPTSGDGGYPHSQYGPLVPSSQV